MIENVGKHLSCPWHDEDRWSGDKRIRAYILGRLHDEGFPVRKYQAVDPGKLDVTARAKISKLVRFFTERFKIEPGHRDPLPWMVLLCDNYQVMSFVSDLVPMIFALSTHASVTRFTMPELVSLVLNYGSESAQEYVYRLRNYGLLTLTSFSQVATKSDVAKANIGTVLGQRFDAKRAILFLDIKKNKNRDKAYAIFHNNGAGALGDSMMKLIMDNAKLNVLDLVLSEEDERDYGRI